MISPSSRSLVIVCAGGFAVEVASFVRDRQVIGEPMQITGFVDDHRFESRFEGAPLLGGIADFGQYLADHADDEFWFLAAVGANRVRAEVIRRLDRLEATNIKPASIVHRTAVLAEDVQVGAGSCIGPGAVITTRVTIGPHSILNANCSVSHGVSLGAFSHVAPGASICSGVVLQEGSFVGAGATIADNVVLGAWSVVEAGAVVTEDVPAHCTVSGSPARIVQRHSRNGRLPILIG